jgi:hypothetical protein
MKWRILSPLEARAQGGAPEPRRDAFDEGTRRIYEQAGQDSWLYCALAVPGAPEIPGATVRDLLGYGDWEGNLRIEVEIESL